MIFVFIQLIIVLVYAEACFKPIPGIQIEQDVDYSGTILREDGEYFLRIINPGIIDQNINFTKKNSSSGNCEDKKFILWIKEDVNFKLKDANTNITISGDIDEVRFDSGTQINTITLDFFVDNNEADSQLWGTDPIPGVLNIDVNKTRILTKTIINMRERERSALDSDGGDVDSIKRVPHGVRLDFKDLKIEKNANLNISLKATKPENQPRVSSTRHGNHGGVAILSAQNIINYGTVDINLFAADGAIGSKGEYRKSKDGGDGGNGGNSKLLVEDGFIKNYGVFSVFLKSGNGGNGGQGSDEGDMWRLNDGIPGPGGVGGNGGSTSFLVHNLENIKEDDKQVEFNINLKTGKGGNGGLAGKNRGGGDDSNNANGGDGGNGGDISITNTLEHNVKNDGKLNYNLVAGDSGAGNAPQGKETQGKHGSSGVGGSVQDYNISEFVNAGVFNYYAISGAVKINNGERKEGMAGSVGSINIDRLKNLTSDFNVVLELNEKDPTNLNSVDCLCSIEDDDDSGNGPDPIDDPSVGDININYLVSGSFLPKNLEIKKNVPVKETKIKIEGCYAESSGNSEISYEADSLMLTLANLATVQYDFDSQSTRVGNIAVEEKSCPVCDGLELNNFALRTDTEYTIYTDKESTIKDLNIYYVNPDGSLFSPPGYPNKDYVVYSLKSTETITPTQFRGTNIKEYKIAKEKLRYNPEDFDLNNIPTEKGYGIDDVRLFCQAQRYLLKFKLEDFPEIKKIYFTPLFDIK